MLRNLSFKRLIVMVLAFAFLGSFLRPSYAQERPPIAYSAEEGFSLPAPGTMVNLSSAYVPVLIKGLKIHPDNPFLFDFILDTGKSGLKINSPEFKAESQKLIKYFLTSLTIKEDDLWVNLSPYEKNKIIPDQLGQTELGRDMLVQDYILKQLTASLIYPEKQLGKEFWNTVYAKAQQELGTSEIPVNTFNKVWIIADKAKILERNNVGYVIGAHLKVMLEEDYLALKNHTAINQTSGNKAHTVASQVVREIIIPALEKEVNEGQHFASLRQIFYSMILATWYRVALKNALLNQVYSNKEKTGGVLSDDPLAKEKIFQQYLKAYKKGVFNFIKEDIDTVSKQPMPRKYFSGGLARDLGIAKILDRAQAITPEEEAAMDSGDLAMVTADMAKSTQEVSNDSAMKSDTQPPGKMRTFMEFASDSLGRDISNVGELELLLMWPLYTFEIDRILSETNDYREAYSQLYSSYARQATVGVITPRSIRSYAPIIKHPFSSVQEVKSLMDVDTEWSIDFLPEPSRWNGPKLYSFILSVMNDGQLHMSFYDGNGLIREFKTDKETENALRSIGIIGKEGLVILTRSSLDERLKNNAVPGIGNRLGISGHSHPKGSGVVPSQTGRMGTPADVELFNFKFIGLPQGYPIDRNIPALAVREKIERESIEASVDVPPAIPYKDLPTVLGTYIQRLDDFAKGQGANRSSLPIDELALYLKVLRAMYGETIGKWEGSQADHHYVHENRSEFAGELAFHPGFQADAQRMLQDSFNGAFRVLAEQFGGSFDDLSSLDEMLSVMSRLVQESSIHPELREMALAIINDPKTYGLDEIDLSNTDFTKGVPVIERTQVPSLEGNKQEVAKPARGVKALISAGVRRLIGRPAEVGSEVPSVQGKELVVKSESTAVSPVAVKAMEFAAVTDGLVAAAEKEKREERFKNKLIPSPEEVVRVRARRLLILVNGAVNDDPQLAEAAFREYLRLLTTFKRIDFYVAIFLRDYKNIITSPALRPTLVEVARSIPDKDDSRNTLTEIAVQLIDEKDIQGALDLLQEVGDATFYTFTTALGRLISLVIIPQGRNETMVKQLERIIENMPDHKGHAQEGKVSLLVSLGEKYEELGNTRRADGYYDEAWQLSARVVQPIMTRLVYFVPLMREKGRRFSKSRDEILAEVRVMAESDLARPYPDERPDKMITLAREYAFNRDYQKAEEAAQYINDNMRWPRDHYDHVYGAIVEAETLYGDDQVATQASFKMTNYRTDHWDRAAQLLVSRGNYRRALEICRFGSRFGEMRVVRNILDRDQNQLGLIKTYLEGAIPHGLDHWNLESLVELISDYPSLDPDGQFILQIFNAAFEHNRSIFAHDSQRIILQNLRKIIMAKVRNVHPSLTGLPDVFREANRQLPPPQTPEDRAQMSLAEKGGIDLNSKNMAMTIAKEGKGVEMNFDPAMVAEFRRGNFSGIVANIIRIVPIKSALPVMRLTTNLTADTGHFSRPISDNAMKP